MDAADLSGNGYLDLLVGGHLPQANGPHDSFVYIYWNGPEGLSESRRMQLSVNTANCLSIADFDNDGHLDLFVGCYHDGRSRDIDSFIFWGGPGGAFSQKKLTRIAGHSVTASLAADFNEDGWVDLVIANHKIMGDHKGDSFVLMNGPDGFDPRPVTRLPTMGPHGMVPVQPGNQKDRGPEEYYISEPHELPGNACVQKIEWEADVPAKTWVKAQIRLADSENFLDSAVWQGRDGAGSWLDCGEETHRIHHEGGWVQYRLALGAINSGSTPRIQEVKVTISTL